MRHTHICLIFTIKQSFIQNNNSAPAGYSDYSISPNDEQLTDENKLKIKKFVASWRKKHTKTYATEYNQTTKKKKFTESVPNMESARYIEHYQLLGFYKIKSSMRTTSNQNTAGFL